MTGNKNQLYFDVPVELTTTPYRHTTEKFVYGVFREPYTFKEGATPNLAFSISNEYEDDHFYWDGAELFTKDVKLENVSNLYSSDNDLIDQNYLPELSDLYKRMSSTAEERAYYHRAMIFPKNSADDFVRKQPHVLNRDIFPPDDLIETDQLRNRFISELDRYRNASGQLFCRAKEPLLKVAFLLHKDVPKEVVVYPDLERNSNFENHSAVALFRIDEMDEAIEHASFLSDKYKVPVRKESKRYETKISIKDQAAIRADGYASSLAYALRAMNSRLEKKIMARTKGKSVATAILDLPEPVISIFREMNSFLGRNIQSYRDVDLSTEERLAAAESIASRARELQDQNGIHWCKSEQNSLLFDHWLMKPVDSRAFRPR